MKRLWTAAAILVLLLAASLANAWYARHITGQVAGRLEQAQLLAQADNWEEAERLTRRAWSEWQGVRGYTYAVLRHTELDQIARDFRQVLQYAELRELDQYAAVNADLALQLTLLGEMEQPSLSNIL